jgi:hypothetical protein
MHTNITLGRYAQELPAVCNQDNIQNGFIKLQE